MTSSNDATGDVVGSMRRRLSVSRRVARNAMIDVRFGAPLAAVYLRDRSQSNSDYRELELLFDGRIGERDVVVDVGCGAGRVINQWLRMGVDNQIYGLEIDARLAAITRRRLRRRHNVAIVTGDAVANLPPDGTLFFLFNPFDESTTSRFAASIVEIARHSDQRVRIAYLNCKHVRVFQDRPEFTVEIGRLDCHAAAVGGSFAIITIP